MANKNETNGPKPVRGEIRDSASETVELKYMVSLPKDYDPNGDPLPVLFFLHGAGERGDDLDAVKIHGPIKYREQGGDIPFIIVAPLCPEGTWWRLSALDAVYDEVMAQYPIDKTRVYLSGLSMGGFGTWDWASAYPDRFAAIVPICGSSDPFKVRWLKDVPVWAFHGAKDPVVPVERTKVMVEALRQAGAEPKMTIYPDAQHDSWTATYNNPEVYKWLLQHTLESK